MPLQDVSVNCNRDSSLDTTASAEGYVAFLDSGRRLLEPERQPINAPGSPGGRLQANEGFARFPRTHSPLTQQCASASGQIVPIEPPSAPFQFKLQTNNSIHNTIAPAVQNVGRNSVRRGQHVETSSSTRYNGFGNGSRQHFKPDANITINRGTPVLSEPFPKFYDDQTGQEDVQKAAADKGKATTNRNTGVEDKTSQPDYPVSSIVQNTTRSINQAPERHALFSTPSRARTTRPHQAHRPAQGADSALQGLASPYYPLGMEASQQPALNTSQHRPNSISLALKGVSTAMTPALAGNAQIATYPPLVKPLGPYPGPEPGSHHAVSHPSLLPIVPQGCPVSPFANLPMYANHINLVPPAYYSYDSFNITASTLSTIATAPLTDMSIPFAAQNVALPVAPAQMQLQQELVLAEASFENLSKQERMLDQYLAMHMDKLDLQTRRAWTGQRMRIVEDRAVAKDRMNQLQQALGAQSAWPTNMQSNYRDQMPLRSTAEARPINQLNVQAPYWVPNAGAGSKQAVRIRTPNCSTEMDQATTPQGVPFGAENIKRTRMTPPKPTAAVPEDPFTAKTTFVSFSPEKRSVDTWGTRLGPAPPELERLQNEQSEMLESMVSEASRHSTGTLGSTGNISGPASSRDARDRRVPPQVKANQEQYLDAIHQGLGTTGALMLASGKALNVEGQDYKQPRLKYMSRDFERDCWLRKPEVDQRIGVSHSRPLARPFQNIKPIPSAQKSQQTEEWVNGVVDCQKPASVLWMPSMG
jgi:hypothetical protein